MTALLNRIRSRPLSAQRVSTLRRSVTRRSADRLVPGETDERLGTAAELQTLRLAHPRRITPARMD